MYRLLTVALLAAAGVAMLPERSDAQFRYRGNVGGRDGITFGNMPYYGGYGYGYRGYQPYGYGYGYGSRYDSYRPYAGYDRPYGYYGPYGTRYGWDSARYYYSSPNYYSAPAYTYSAPTYTYSAPYVTPLYAQAGSSGTESYQSYYPPSSSQPAANAVRVEVRVPSPNAEVWFDGTPTQQRGTVRTFESPPLTAGRSYTYQIRARWTDADGKAQDQTRSVPVQPGQQAMVDFTRPERTGGE
jgi:uncharacterized protein (TIGR03000 family)